MRDVFWIVKNILINTLKDKKNYFFYFIMPLIGIIISVVAYGKNSVNSINIGVVKNESSYIVDDTINYLSSIGNFNIKEIDKDEINKKVVTQDVDSVLIFNEGFTKSLLSGKTNNIEITSIKGSSTTGFLKSYIYEYLDNIIKISKLSNNDDEKFKSIYDDVRKNSLKINVTGIEDSSKNKDIAKYSIGFLLMITLMNSGSISEIILKERRDKTFLRILTAPVSSKTFLLSNLIASFIILFIQNLITLIVLVNIFKVNIYVSFVELLFLLNLFSIVGIGVSMSIISICRTYASVSATQTLVFVLTSMLSGCYFDISFMPKQMQRIADFFPQRWLLDSITTLQSTGKFSSIYMHIAILLAFAVVFFLLAIFGFKKINDVRDFV